MKSREYIFRSQNNYFFVSLIITILLIICLLIITFYEYNPYYTTNGIYDKEDEIVSVVLENNKLFYINTSEVKINNKIIDNNDIYINEYVSLENKIFVSISIPFVLDKNEYLVDVLFKLPKTTILKKLWKGLME